jgi:hypothetical protein
MPRNADSSGTAPTSWAVSLGGWSVRVACHAIGVASVATLLLVPYVDTLTLQTFWEAAQHASFVELTWVDAMLHVGLAACLWTLVVLLFEIVTAKREPVSKLLNLERGSVMTETLVILPVFFLLTFGIAQLAVNNIAGLLANSAVFQAGRTVWLWSSEADEGRRGVSDSMVRKLAHAQAAAVLTPVAPGEFVQSAGASDVHFEQMRGILLGSQQPSMSTDTGQDAMTAVSALLNGDNMSNESGRDSAFFRAFDTSSWPERTVRKFTFAHHATTITIVESSDEIGVNLIYNHHQAFPMVGAIFGDSGPSPGGRSGYYAVLEREFTMPKQIPPNPTVPP